MNITFSLNGTTVSAPVQTGTETLLDFLREAQGLTGTKEGCNEGDCGACSVIVTGPNGTPQAVNSCILFLPQLHGKAVRTVEGIAAPDGTLHPVQAAMVEHHGSQCGFCTPGFITTMAAAHTNGVTDFDDALSGNLCRCTGYAPIVKAAKAAAKMPVAVWVKETAPGGHISSDRVFCPKDTQSLADWYVRNPDATLVAGGTDTGLWVTKQLRELSPVAFLSTASDLSGITDEGKNWRVEAATTITEFMDVIGITNPSLYAMLARYGSPQVRNMATIGGNIANGSPIGDGPPALIAMGAELVLRQGDARRLIGLENFFIEYGKQDRQPGEFIEAILVPKAIEDLRCYKLSKRFDQDISAVCGCINVSVEAGTITEARIAFGGMAGTPARARCVEAALTGKPFSKATFDTAASAMAKDYTPMSDARASADYRMQTAQNMLRRYFWDLSGTDVSVRKVTL